MLPPCSRQRPSSRRSLGAGQAQLSLRAPGGARRTRSLCRSVQEGPCGGLAVSWTLTNLPRRTQLCLTRLGCAFTGLLPLPEPALSPGVMWSSCRIPGRFCQAVLSPPALGWHETSSSFYCPAFHFCHFMASSQLLTVQIQFCVHEPLKHADSSTCVVRY